MGRATLSGFESVAFNHSAAVAYFDARYDAPLARNTIDEAGMSLLRQWIESLPGPKVLPPPEISPRGGNFFKPGEVVLKSEPGAKIYYTIDGTAPTTSDWLYEKPIQMRRQRDGF